MFEKSPKWIDTMNRHGVKAWYDYGVFFAIEVSTRDGKTFERAVPVVGNRWSWLGY